MISRQGTMGDVIKKTPIAARLRKLLGPEPIINIETGQLGVYINNPHVSGVNGPEPEGSYHRVINLDLVYERRPRMHAVDAFMMETFADASRPAGETFIYRESVSELPELPWHKIAALHATRSSRNRTFPQSFWQAVIDGLKSAQLCGRTTTSLVLLRGRPASLAATPGLLHVAGSTATPIVGIYTSVFPEYRMPYRKGILGWQVTTLVPSLSCVGCLADEPPPVTSVRCRRGDYACVEADMVAPAAVVEAARAYIG